MPVKINRGGNMHKKTHFTTWFLLIINICFGILISMRGWSPQYILEVGGMTGNMPTSQGLYQFLPFAVQDMTNMVGHFPFLAHPITGIPLLIIRALNASFLHFSWIHLLSNMVVLYTIGRRFEELNYKGSLFIIYIVTGIVSMLSAYILQPDTLTAGASGAIFGIMGASLILSIKARIELKRKQIDNITATNYINEGKMVYGLIIFNLIMTFIIPNISIVGHISGLIMGMLLGLLLPLKYWK